MLTLGRYVGQSIFINDELEIIVVSKSKGVIKLGFIGPMSYNIVRSEIRGTQKKISAYNDSDVLSLPFPEIGFAVGYQSLCSDNSVEIESNSETVKSLENKESKAKQANAFTNGGSLLSSNLLSTKKSTKILYKRSHADMIDSGNIENVNIEEKK
jgi:carbon storage regulator CsrA